jgi:hypothetical protein
LTQGPGPASRGTRALLPRGALGPLMLPSRHHRGRTARRSPHTDIGIRKTHGPGDKACAFGGWARLSPNLGISTRYEDGGGQETLYATPALWPDRDATVPFALCAWEPKERVSCTAHGSRIAPLGWFQGWLALRAARARCSSRTSSSVNRVPTAITSRMGCAGSDGIRS